MDEQYVILGHTVSFPDGPSPLYRRERKNYQNA